MMTPRLFLSGGLALAALALAGCGGGGGGGNNNGGNPGPGPVPAPSAVQGKVVDTTGAVVPGVTVTLDSGQSAVTLSQGGYRIENAPSGLHTVTASISQNGQSYTGQTQVAVAAGSLLSNTNLVVSPPGDQGTISGRVQDSNGHAVSGARVLLQFPITTGGGQFSAETAFTSGDGTYQLSRVPVHNASNALIAYALSASDQGYLNQSVSNIFPSASAVNFTLTSGSGSVSLPSNLTAYAFTQPGSGSQPFAAGHSPSGVYGQIRRALSPGYAHLAAHHPAGTVKHLTARARPNQFGSSVIEIDLAFTPATDPALLGYTVYRTQGSSFPQQGQDQYDFLQDPLANFYTDIDEAYSANTTYNFALSSTNSNNQETNGLSAPASVTPLGALTLSQPQSGQSTIQPVQYTWNAVLGVSSYSIFVYDQWPGAETSPVQTVSNILSPAYSLSGLNSGQDYWTIVAGVTADGRAVTVSQIVRFHVQ